MGAVVDDYRFYPLQQAGLLTQLRDVRPVIVLEHLVAEDGVCDLWRVHQVHFEQTRLQRPLRWPVVFQRVQQEGSALLDHVGLHEHIDYL